MRRLYRVKGLDCAHEGALLRRELEGAPGADAVAFDYPRGRMAVTGPIAPKVMPRGPRARGSERSLPA